MARLFKRLRSGDIQISASTFNRMMDRLEAVTVDSPGGIFSSTVGRGMGIDPDDLEIVQVAKFQAFPGSGSYPSWHKEQLKFPAVLFPAASYDKRGWHVDERKSKYIEGTVKSEAYVYNISGLWIPDGTESIAWLRNGLWWTNYLYTFLRGELGTQLNAGGSAQMRVKTTAGTTSGDNWLEIFDETMEPGKHLKVGAEVHAALDVMKKQWWLINAKCPYPRSTST